MTAEAESENEIEPVENIVQTTVDPRENEITEPAPRTSFVPQENKLSNGIYRFFKPYITILFKFLDILTCNEIIVLFLSTLLLQIPY